MLLDLITSSGTDPVYISSPCAQWEIGHDEYIDWLNHPSVTDVVDNDPERASVQHYSFFSVSPFQDTEVGAAYPDTACIKAEKGK